MANYSDPTPESSDAGLTNITEMQNNFVRIGDDLGDIANSLDEGWDKTNDTRGLRGHNIGAKSGSWADRPGGSGTRSGQTAWDGLFYRLDGVGLIRYDGSDWVVDSGRNITAQSTSLDTGISSFTAAVSFSGFTRINGGRLKVHYSFAVRNESGGSLSGVNLDVRLQDTSNSSTLEEAEAVTGDSFDSNGNVRRYSGFFFIDTTVSGGGTDSIDLEFQVNSNQTDSDLKLKANGTQGPASVDLHYVADTSKALG